MADKKKFSRREFLKRLGVTSASAVAIAAFDPLSFFKDDNNVNSSPIENADGMTYRIHRKSKEKVSLLGYGMMRLPRKGRGIDQELVNQQVKYALQHGVNYFDTSPHYVNNQSEKSLGIALKASGFDRKDFFVATKMSNFGEDEWSYEKSVELYQNSFKQLQVDYIDYYLLHGIGMGGMENFQKRFIDNGILKFLLKERKKGRIKKLGFSYHGDVAVFDHLLANHKKYKWDFAQIQMNFVDWKHSKEMNPRNTNSEYLNAECEKRGIQTVMMEPLMGGRLAKLKDVYSKQLRTVRPEDTDAAWAFRFCGSQPNVLTELSGMTTMENLVENVKTFSPLDPCTDEEFALLEEIAANMVTYPNIPCTNCKYCMPCPYGVDIPANFAFYNNSVNEGTLPPANKDAVNYDERKKSFINKYKKDIKAEQLASACVACEECLTKCPQRIKIPDQMAKLTQLLQD